MRAVGLDFEQRKLARFELAEPAPPGPGEVLLRIHEVGVCATDRELARFRFGVPPAGETRLVLGHEALAQVVESRSEALRPGDWVVPTVRRACTPACRSCAAGRSDLCRTGAYQERGIAGLHGFFTEYTVEAAANLLPVPEALADVAVLGEPMSVVRKAIETALRCHPLEPRTAAIAGAGPIGILLAFSLQAAGFDCTVCSLEDADDPRVHLLREAGIAYKQGRPAERCDLVFDACGRRADLLEWLDVLGVLVFVGAAEQALTVEPIQLLIANQTLTGVINSSREHFEQGLLELARLRRPLLGAMLQRSGFDELPAAIQGAAGVLKSVHVL